MATTDHPLVLDLGSVIGPMGPAGISTTSGEPSSASGYDGEMRIDPATGIVYAKSSGSWSVACRLQLAGPLESAIATINSNFGLISDESQVLKRAATITYEQGFSVGSDEEGQNFFLMCPGGAFQLLASFVCSSAIAAHTSVNVGTLVVPNGFHVGIGAIGSAGDRTALNPAYFASFSADSGVIIFHNPSDSALPANTSISLRFNEHWDVWDYTLHNAFDEVTI